MAKYIYLFIFSVLIFTNVFGQQTAKSFKFAGKDINYYEHLPDDYNTTSNTYPVIVFLHGIGELSSSNDDATALKDLEKVAANGTPMQIKNGSFPKSFTVGGKTYKFIVISPQLRTFYSGSSWHPAYIAAVMNYVKKNYRVDASRIYLTGLSMGGGGVWDYAGNKSSYADSLAAIAPVCGASQSGAWNGIPGIIAKSNLPVWAFHGSADGTVSPQTSKDFVANINNITPNLAYLTLYPGVGHSCWGRAYSLTSDAENIKFADNVYIWLLQHQRTNLIPTIPPLETPQITANDIVPSYQGKYRYGSNLGYYKQDFSDYNLAELIDKVGGHTLRPSLPNKFLEENGYNIRLQTFKDYQQKLDMQDVAAFVGEPVAETLRDKTIYDNLVGESQVFKNLYQPIWNSDGSVNTENYYANYVYKSVQIYGPYVKFWEVWNEPDFTTSYAKQAEWLTRAPEPKELQNLKAPFYSYIRMLRITYEVVKKYYPNSYICTGGLGYTEFLDAILRYTDNPNNGDLSTDYPLKGGAYFDVLSFHYYPNYTLKQYDTPRGTFDYFFHSDSAAKKVVLEKLKFEKTLTDRGYNGNTFPKKLFVMTETGVSKKSFDKEEASYKIGGYRYGSEEYQRNFVVKMDILSQKNDIKQTYFYTLGDFGELNDANKDEFSLMGFYKNLTTSQAGPTNVTKTQSGIAHTTTSTLLYNYTYNAAKTQSLNLPADVDGAAFTKDNETRYILWAKTKNTEDEDETAEYTFPTNLGIQYINKYEWDFSATNKFNTSTSLKVSLTAAPSIFVINDTATTIDPVDSVETGDYSLFPTPSYDNVTLRIKAIENGNGNYTIYNIGGQQVKSGSFLKNSETKDIPIEIYDFTPGIYLVKVKLDNAKKPQVIKMIKTANGGI